MEPADLPRPPAPATVRVIAVRPIGDGDACELVLADERRFVVGARPDRRSARRVLAGLGSLGSVRFDLGASPRASVVGAARRLPVRRPVPLGAALALSLGGARTCARVPVDVHEGALA